MSARKRRIIEPGTRDKAGRTLVFSFGSNLHDGQLRDRCPDAIAVGPATVQGYRLAFVAHSARWGGAVATLRRAPGCATPGELVLLTDADLARLDGYEGAPHVYRRIQVPVSAQTAAGKWREVTAWTYVRDGDEDVPSLAYVARIACGYGRLGYGDDTIVRAIGEAQRSVEARWSGAIAAHRSRAPRGGA